MYLRIKKYHRKRGLYYQAVTCYTVRLPSGTILQFNDCHIAGIWHDEIETQKKLFTFWAKVDKFIKREYPLHYDRMIAAAARHVPRPRCIPRPVRLWCTSRGVQYSFDSPSLHKKRAPLTKNEK